MVKQVFFFLTMLCAVSFHSINASPIDLAKDERGIYSQNGEDGVLEKIFSVIGTTNQYYVEFGTQSAKECNTRNLRENHGWEGLLMDGSYEDPSVDLYKEFITADNINDLFAKYDVPHEFDLLSIDIDYNDFYVWRALENYAPRVVVIEYNATHLPTEDKVVVYKPDFIWDKSNYYGASILSLYQLGLLKGYTLVYAENRGVNLFFIRDDVVADFEFKNAGNVARIYKSPKYGYGPNSGHPADLFNRPYLSFYEAFASEL